MWLDADLVFCRQIGDAAMRMLWTVSALDSEPLRNIPHTYSRLHRSMPWLNTITPWA
tara:strand:+ start:168 stop:338 length:171 start_codon:yes stop_codon:yes gene_type:complete